jgi:hypothetical protein
MLLLNNKPFNTLDNYLDIDHFLSLKDEFFFMYAKNLHHTKASWNAAGIPMDCNWKYLTEKPLLYTTYHNIALKDPSVKEKLDYFNNTGDKDGLAKFLQLKYGAFSPYRILHLSTKDEPLHDFVEKPIREWIDTLPFDKINLVSIFCNEHHCPLKYHRDYNFDPVNEGDNNPIPSTLQDVIWLRFDLNRHLYLYDFDADGNIIDQCQFEGYSVNFNHYNWHGNTDSFDTATLTVKVEGKFTEDFKKKIYV